jgi:hypothetical protein
MRFEIAPTLLSLLLAGRPLAVPTVVVIEDSTDSLAISSLSTSPDASSSSPQSQAGTPCTPAVMALASGIQANIADQNNELNTVTALGFILAQNPLNTTLYSATQASLLGFITKGIAIRENNQKISPAGNAAIPGLATVAMAQMVELSLTQNLVMGGNGTDVVKANATVETLKGDFKGGIVQNMKNLAAVSSRLPLPSAVYVC